MKERERFNEGMDKILLENDFAYYDDWKYGPATGWEWRIDHPSIRLIRHDFGYWIIFGVHASGENPRMNIGSSNSAEDIIALRDALARCPN